MKDIDLSKESPCGHGVVTCFSIYGGDSEGNVCNFASDADGVKQDQLWVDTLLGGNEVRRHDLLHCCIVHVDTFGMTHIHSGLGSGV